MKFNLKAKTVQMVLFVLLLAVIFCLIATTFKIFSIDELPVNFIAALLEAVVAAIITASLLSGQSSAEEVKERNVEVFKKKSDIFQNYISIVWKAWEDHKVDAVEYGNLTGLYYRELMLYMTEDSTKKIGGVLKSIGEFVEKDSLPDTDRKVLQTALITIINTLSKEISLGGQIDEKLFMDLDKNREAAEEKRARKQNRSFKSLGIKPGAELALKANPDIKCKTVDEKNKVSYEDRVISISGLAVELLERPANGFAEFTLGGKILSEMDKKE